MPHRAAGALPGNPTLATATLLGTVTIAGRAENVAYVRAFVTWVLPARHSCLDTAWLLTSELVANAIQHTDSGLDGGTVTVVLLDGGPGLRVEVSDNGSPRTVPLVQRHTAVIPPGGVRESGRGLVLVEALADDWGYRREPATTTVWFRLTC